MSSISQPLFLSNYSHFTINGFRISNRWIIRFQHQYLPIDVAAMSLLSSRSVAHLFPGNERLARRSRISNRRRRVGFRDHGGLREIEDEEDRGIDLLVRFLQNMFKKITRKARKAVRSVLPVSIPTELVCFSVDGVTMLTFLWLAKAFIEVVCTVGSVVFISILLIRGIWYGITYIQESRANRMNLLSEEQWWSSTRPAI